MFTQLATPVPLFVQDKGDGFAIAVIDYGQEHNLIWVTIIDETGEIWCAPNSKVRAQKNWTMGRHLSGKQAPEARPDRDKCRQVFA
ncbi:MAG: hypothetical protein CMK06_14060 [Ponticaulis sp.]|nr:hypothetical protein [Ponticaulis sp.]